MWSKEEEIRPLFINLVRILEVHHLTSGSKALKARLKLPNDNNTEEIDGVLFFKCGDHKFPSYIEIDSRETIERLICTSGCLLEVPPEIVADEGIVPHVCDIWSLGIALYSEVVGHSPWMDGQRYLSNKVDNPHSEIGVCVSLPRNGADDYFSQYFEARERESRGSSFKEKQIQKKSWASYFSDKNGLGEQILGYRKHVKYPTNISRELKDLLQKMIQSPRKRITLREILSHPWITELNPYDAVPSLMTDETFIDPKSFVLQNYNLIVVEFMARKICGYGGGSYGDMREEIAWILKGIYAGGRLGTVYRYHLKWIEAKINNQIDEIPKFKPKKSNKMVPHIPKSSKKSHQWFDPMGF